MDETRKERWEREMEERFFFMYHLGTSYSQYDDIPERDRQWLIKRFVDQKKSEDEAAENARRKAKKGAAYELRSASGKQWNLTFGDYTPGAQVENE